MKDLHPIIQKIIEAPQNTYVIFFVRDCPYSRKALDLLRTKNVKYKGYNINEIKGNMPRLLEVLNKHVDMIYYDPSHKTKPVIFYNGKFIGGFDELNKILNSPNDQLII